MGKDESNLTQKKHANILAQEKLPQAAEKKKEENKIAEDNKSSQKPPEGLNNTIKNMSPEVEAKLRQDLEKIPGLEAIKKDNINILNKISTEIAVVSRSRNDKGASR